MGMGGAAPAAGASGGSASGEQAGKAAPPPFPPPKDCRACSGAQSMISMFQRMTDKGHQRDQTGSKAGASASSSTSNSSSSSLKAAAAAGMVAAAGAAAASAAEASTSQPAQGQQPPSPLPCPPDTAQIGKATWTFLHTMAAYYPEEPTLPQRSLMRSMMEGLAEFYPCSICAEHLREQIKESPPDVTSNTGLSMWLCKIHNEVNQMLGKPLFDCSRALERWRDGPADETYDCLEEQ